MSKTNDIRRHNSTDVLMSGGKEADTRNRVEVHADGSILTGPGGVTAPDTTLRRASAGSWAVPIPITGGIPSDADFAVAPPNGTVAINGSNDQQYYRKAGVWTPMNVPPAVPGAPSTITASSGDTQVTLDWSAAAANGSTVTGYTWTVYKVSDNTVVSTGSVGNVLTKVITGLTNGTAVYGKVLATNGVGSGPQSAASNSATPQAPAVPDAPSAASAVGGSTTADVTFTPGSNNGSARIGCRITPYIGAAAQTAQTFATTATTQTVTGLTNGTTYTFKVEDQNGIGFSSMSTATNAVTPGLTTYFSDNFNRADGALAAPWVNSNTPGNTSVMTIVGNAVQCVGGNQALSVQDSTATDHAIQADVTSFNGEVVLWLRTVDANNGIIVSFQSAGASPVYERRAGAHNLISAPGHGITNGTNVVIKAKAVGDQITIYVDGSLVATVTVPAPAHAALGSNTKCGIGGAFGFAAWNASTFLDNAICTNS